VIGKKVNRLIMILVTAVLMLLTLLNWQLSAVRVVFAIALVTILPGYALTTAIFVNQFLGFAEKVAFSCGFSLGLVALGGLALNYFPRLGVSSVTWVILLGGVTLFFSWVALARMRDETKVDTSTIEVPLPISQLVLMILAGGIIMGAFLTARAGAENRPSTPFTQVWLLWADESQSDVLLGVQNQEGVTRQYRLQISMRQGVLQEWETITLEPGETWESRYTPPPNITETDFIKANIYRLDMPQDIYREVYLRHVAR